MSVPFRIAVNKDKETVFNILCRHYLTDNKKIIVSGNIVYIKNNEDFNKELSLIHEDKFLYYECNIDFYPIENTLTLENQICCVKEISKIFSENKIDFEVISEFESLLT